MQACPNDECPHRKLTGQRAVFEGAREHCSDCETALVTVESEEPAEVPAATPVVPSGRGRRLAVSLVITAGLELASRAEASLVSEEHFVDPGGFDAFGNVSALSSARASVIAAFLYVELVALLVPWLRRRRHDHPVTRRRLTIAAGLVALLTSASQGWALCMAGDAYGMDDAVRSQLLATFAAAPLVIFLAAWAIGRFGLGGPWPWLVAGSFAAMLGDRVVWWVRSWGLDAGRVAAEGVWIVAWGALGGWFLRRRFESTVSAGAKGPKAAYRGGPSDHGQMPLSLRAPLWGTAPLWMSAALIVALPGVRPYIPSVAPVSEALQRDPWARAGALTLVALALTELFARLPTSLRRIDERLAPLGLRAAGASATALARARAATRRMVLAAGALVLAGGVAGIQASDLTLGVYTLTIVAIALDLVGEWRALGRLGPLAPVQHDQRVWLADATAAVLERAGVPAFVRSANYRQLAWWAAPQAPVAVMVPVDRLDEARALLEGEEPEPDATAS